MSIKDYFALGKIRLVLGVTHYVTNALAAKGHNVIYFPPGIMLPEKKTRKNDKLTITFVGRHHIWTKRKGLRYLLDALSVVKSRNPSLEFTLQLIGEVPPGFSQILKKYDSLQLQTLGLLPREATLELIAKSHLLVAPSLYDEFGYAVLEAEACRTPALVSMHNPSFRELVDKELAVDIYDKEKFACALEELLKDKDRLIELGKNVREFVDMQYSWKIKIPALIKLYEGVLSSNKMSL